MEIVIDLDGFFLPTQSKSKFMKRKRIKVWFENDKEDLKELFEQYYLGFRSSLFVCENSLKVKDINEANKAIREYCEACVPSALNCMKKHLASKPLLPADFIWITKSAITNILQKEFPNVKYINLCLSMKPQLSAKTINKNTIIFPALTRTVLTHCNLVIINSISDILSEDGHLTGTINCQQLARFIFPYLLFCHDSFSVQNLPIIGARSTNAVQTAFHFTNLQLLFIFAHEYAHILLKHANSYKEPWEKENEADSFALKVVLAYTKKVPSYSEYDVFAAIRWLFKYQLIEESIGILTRGKEIENYNSSFEKRRGQFQSELFANSEINGSTIFESLGFCMIVELQKTLYENGLEIISDMIEIFHKSERTGEIEPWWKKIKPN